MRTDPKKITGHGDQPPLARYGAAVAAFHAAVDELVASAAALGESVGGEPIEFVELNRLSMHRRVDDASDLLAVNYPEPGRFVVRTAAYIELLDLSKEKTS